MKLFDTHAHLNDNRYEEDRDAMIRRAVEGGVLHTLIPGVDRVTTQEGIALARTYPHLYAAVGFHPHEAKHATEADYADFYDWAKAEDAIVAVGEIGLDYYYEHSDRATQQRVFVEQMELARQLDMPILIHDREAHGDVMRLLRAEGRGVRGIFHCYSGSYEMAMEAIALDFYISFAGPVVFPKSTQLKEVARRIPIDRVLIETDAPYLTPPPYRGQRNETLYVAYVAQEIAQLRGMDFETVADITFDNACRALGITSPTVSP